MRAMPPGNTMAMMIDEIVAPVIAVNTCRRAGVFMTSL